jgi:3-oxoacyl-[acyl-carrier-protein] synthase II
MLKVEAYINGTACISPQKTIDSKVFPTEITVQTDVRYLKCDEPVYKKFIDPMVTRRLSRILKMGLYTGIACLKDAGINNPDAIITGTGLGCIEDTEKFLFAMIMNDEKSPNPTPFIQSTHNTISSQISLYCKCHGYNITYAHRGLSFENALYDSMMLLNEKAAKTILLGGIDEMTDNSFYITDRLGFWKKEKYSYQFLNGSSTKGSIGGEGSSFFLLSNKPTIFTYAKVVALETFSYALDQKSLEKETAAFLEKNDLRSSDIDLVLLGISGDKRFDHIYHDLKANIFANNTCSLFKHLCGDYFTASSFAMWLASVILREQSVPAIIRIDDKPVKQLKNILIYNHYRNTSHSFILLRHAEF